MNHYEKKKHFIIYKNKPKSGRNEFILRCMDRLLFQLHWKNMKDKYSDVFVIYYVFRYSSILTFYVVKFIFKAKGPSVFSNSSLLKDYLKQNICIRKQYLPLFLSDITFFDDK